MDEIEAIRAFNRFYLGALGLLGRGYLGSGLGIAEVRVLWELGHAPVPLAARDLARGLGLDEGYLSRVIAGFAARGWVLREADPADARRRMIRLTPAGRAALAPLEERSRAEMGQRLSRLSPAAAAELAGAAGRMRALLGDPAILAEPVEIRDLAPGDAGWLIERHAVLYARDEGFDARFEALVAEILAGFIRNRDAERERAFIAWSGGRRLGSVFCVRQSGEVAKLRLFLLEPEARGRGLGRHLLRLCLDWAAARGYRRMVLWTHESHEAACALYARAGFTLTESQATRSFGQEVVEQTWEIALPAPGDTSPDAMSAPRDGVQQGLAIAGSGR